MKIVLVVYCYFLLLTLFGMEGFWMSLDNPRLLSGLWHIIKTANVNHEWP